MYLISYSTFHYPREVQHRFTILQRFVENHSRIQVDRLAIGLRTLVVLLDLDALDVSESLENGAERIRIRKQRI